LLVVAGCAVLETAQPAFAADPGTEVPSAPDAAEVVVEETETPPANENESLIYPRGNDPLGRESPLLGDDRSDLPGTFTWVLALALIGGGAWVFWKKRTGGSLGSAGRKIQIEETRPMGNRQYLIIARCEGKRFLLGVTPGRIDVVSPLDATTDDAAAEAGEVT
jgi:flagellar protein FliO/FliZ